VSEREKHARLFSKYENKIKSFKTFFAEDEVSILPSHFIENNTHNLQHHLVMF
jgi:hypothetical protein